MFTVKTINKTLSGEIESVYLNEWSNICVWLKGSQNYKDKVESLKADVLSDKESDQDEIEQLLRMHETYKAFITYENDGDEEWSYYCVADNEEIYITDRHGNTVHSIR